MDTHGRKAPHPLGVLSHYKAVVWETGDDIIPRATGQPAGTATRATLETELAVRDYLNEGGKLLYGGKYAGFAPAANGQYVYQPEPAGRSAPRSTDPTCLPLFNDFQQYWLGAYTYVDDGGTGADGTRTRWSATPASSTGFTAALNAAGSAGNQDHTGVVPDHVELPAGRASSRSSPARPGRLGHAGRRRRTTRTTVTGICGAGRPTRRTSG